MKVLHVITGLSRSAGGPARSSQGLVAALCKAGVDAWIWALDGSSPWLPGVKDASALFPNSSFLFPSFDLVHVHGIWSWKLHQVCVACRKSGIPYVIAPRGMLEPWSLKQKWLKKRVARWLYQDKDLKCAAALHATAESEAEQFRKLGFKNEIIVSPNGVNVPVGTFKVKVKGEGEQRRALFVSRMHPKKGVMELVEAFAKVKDKGEGERWCVELVYTVSGETEREYEQKVLRRVQELGLTFTHHCPPPPRTSTSQSPDIIFTGALDDEKKWEAYARADLFVLPTYSENFGIVVAEALWAGVPVITTKGTPWEDLVDSKCGWWIDLPDKGTDPADWKALQDALKEAMTSAPLGEMGRRGHELVEQKYTWGAVVKAVVDGYRCVV